MPSVVVDLIGGFFAEILVAFTLYGITIAQTYFYWYTYPDDPKLIKCLVLALWVFETLHTVFCGHIIWTYMIIDFGILPNIGSIVWSAGASVFVAMAIATIVQGFLIRRVWIMSKRSLLITAVPAIVFFVRISFGLATASLTYAIGTWSQFRQRVGPLFTLACGLSLAAFLDLLIALILIHYLRRTRGTFKQTDDLVNSLMAYIINTGALTTVVSIVIVLTFVFLKNSLLFAGLIEVQSKLYANSMLATLNARQIMRNKQTPFNSGEIELSVGREAVCRIPMSTDTRRIEIFQDTSKVTDASSARAFTDLEIGREHATRKDAMM